MNSRTTRAFWKCFDAQPSEARRQAVRVGLHWRALGTRGGDVVIWFWIGSHADYDHLVG